MSPPSPFPARPVLTHIVRQHAEEASFLWLLRDAAVDAPHYRPRDLARLEERIEAHIDGLRVAGPDGVAAVLGPLGEFPEPGEVFAAAALLLGDHDPSRLDSVLDLVRTAPDGERGLFGALGWTRPALLRAHVQHWLASSDGFERRLAVVACSVHRGDPNRHLARLIEDPDRSVRARALRLAGELGRTDLTPAIAESIGDASDPDAAFWAAWSAGLLGWRDAALPTLMATAQGDGPHTARALDLAIRLLDPQRAATWVRALNGAPALAVRVVQALGRLGEPAAVPWLIARMAEPVLARAAGESFALITGADLTAEDLDAPRPDGADAEDPGPDTELPWPSPERVDAWWARNAHRFAPGARHLLGRPIAPDTAADAFTRGYQRQRRAAAFELAVLRPGAGLPNWRARVGRS